MSPSALAVTCRGKPQAAAVYSRVEVEASAGRHAAINDSPFYVEFPRY